MEDHTECLDMELTHGDKNVKPIQDIFYQHQLGIPEKTSLKPTDISEKGSWINHMKNNFKKSWTDWDPTPLKRKK